MRNKAIGLLLVMLALALACPAMAEGYDNVGLLIGRPARRVKTLITALDATEAVIAYAVAKGAQMIVTHHPMPFRPVHRITDESRDGGRILSLSCQVILGWELWRPRSIRRIFCSLVPLSS